MSTASRLCSPTAAIAALLLCAATAAAAPPEVTQVKSRHGFDTLVERLRTAIAEQRMGLVAEASASRGAAARGVNIPGNAVLMVFRNDYAVRTPGACPPASRRRCAST